MCEYQSRFQAVTDQERAAATAFDLNGRLNLNVLHKWTLWYWNQGPSNCGLTLRK